MKKTNPSLICIRNNGKDIGPETNFWETTTALAGNFIMSTNAGCIRLLLPDAWLPQLPDMIKGAKHVVISILDSVNNDSEGVIMEFLIEDGSGSPFVLATSQAGVMGIPCREVPSRPWLAAIWGRKHGRIHKYMERTAYVRYVSALPCLDPFPGVKSN